MWRPGKKGGSVNRSLVKDKDKDKHMTRGKTKNKHKSMDKSRDHDNGKGSNRLPTYIIKPARGSEGMSMRSISISMPNKRAYVRTHRRKQ